MARAQAPSSSTDDAVIGRATRVRGRVQGDGNLFVEGEVEGGVAVSGAVTIADGASVLGDVDGSEVTIAGKVDGNVSARGAVAIRVGADVSGDVGASEVSLEEGASFTGRVEADFDLPPELS